MEDQNVQARHDEQDHLHLEGEITGVVRGLGDEHPDAGQRGQHTGTRGPGHDLSRDATHGMTAGRKAEQPQVQHQNRAQQEGRGQYVDGLEEREPPRRPDF